MTNKSRRINVLVPFVGDSVGGAQISGISLVRNLDQELFKVFLVVHENGPLTEYLAEHKVPFIILPLAGYQGRQKALLSYLKSMISTAPRLVQFLKENEIDIVHALDSRMNLTWLIPARLSSARFIWNQHSVFSSSRMLTLYAGFANKIICITEITHDSLPEKLKANSTIIEVPVQAPDEMPDRVRSKSELCSSCGIQPNQPVVGFFGNLTKQKRPEMVIKIAAESAKTEGPDPVFVLFGSDRDNLKAELIKLTQSYGQNERIIFREFVPNPEFWMAGCDIVIAPGVNEAFGRTVIEAMLVSTPIVASDSGGHQKIVKSGKTGYLVPEDDVQMFSRTIKNVLQNKNLAQSISANALTEVSSRYSIARHAKKISIIYREILN
jgi:glycosyltransferase involved in cell wall biosynthesis